MQGGLGAGPELCVPGAACSGHPAVGCLFCSGDSPFSPRKELGAEASANQDRRASSPELQGVGKRLHGFRSGICRTEGQ